MTAPPFRSVNEIFLHRVSESGDRKAFDFPVSRKEWSSLTWRETAERVRAVACGLRALGLEPTERCAIVSGTRLEWILSDLGILCAGGATTTIYPSSTAEEAAFILGDSQSRVAIVENREQVGKLASVRDRLPELKKVVVIDGKDGHDGWVTTFAQLEEEGRRWDEAHPGAYDAFVREPKPEDLATLMYTSGTTGRPKGVELTHDCWVAEGEAIEGTGMISASDHLFLWLPLSHSFGKMLVIASLQVGFSTAVDGRITRLVQNLALVRPTFSAAAPRVFEKVRSKMVTTAASGGDLKYGIFNWAMGVGRKVSALAQQKQAPGPLLAAQHALADKLVLSKLRAVFGGRMRFFISGSAPLSRDVAEFFHAIGVLVSEGYGLTETCAATFVNRPEAFRFGTVGPPFPGIEVRIAPEDNEILLRGRPVMRGYHNLPADTEEAFTEDGWFRTGDIGELDDAGFLRITDRKKDLIKTSGGKYVAPQKLESQLKVLSPYVANVLVHGNERNYCTALVTLDEETLRGWARENGLDELPVEALAEREEVHALVKGAVDELNAGLASFETIKRFTILPRDFDIDEGELTPSLKVKRKVVESRYRDALDRMYAPAA